MATTSTPAGARGGARPPARERLLDAAGELFYRDGIRAVGIDAVIERAGVAKMSLYKHFRSKDDLVVAYLQRREQRWREHFQSRMRAAGTTPRERVLAVFDVLANWTESENPRGCAFINAYVELADAGHPGNAVARADKEWLRAYLTELVAETRAPDPETLSAQLFLLLEGALVTTAMGTVDGAMSSARAAAERLLPD
ncbi:TetR family transcriptional regulator [Saccharopolyspora erythraea NRRL 2338]|uniref:Transcriptional regulator, TetR family n=2 Tax=Saccharopolyspora erythraea TaxID=1836 RepID=A4FFA0_SACEN|nr:TetR/AcrR family transcriptional regulator [Saccharopolyspora erythraea]EQD81670.1 TetR family transcriptional regulator [Saccharopolyspora erythraea D]PFG96448.1 TetR family transcriptional regulator [Saccharopolyspora erythraea NRRL 2338]QRK92944.1 TetR/AcrR family transcriptional regulator [Saccharopolyspora erythraea]CAM02725.1 transcriptional regulator, TetR family [Saccharopolyspora erythraea NRRL 2338]